MNRQDAKDAKKCILRSTAKTGDYVFLTGALGKNEFNKPFTPRIKEAKYLVDNFKVNSMIDISDGLSSEILHICLKTNIS